jgi:DNA/RNA endonuclease YhcR with UshA esterase domain
MRNEIISILPGELHSMKNLSNRLNIFVMTFGLVAFGPMGMVPAIAAVKTMPASNTDLASINTDMVDSQVEVEATIKSISPPHEGSKAPYRLSLADATGLITLVIWPDMYETIKAQSPLSQGDLIHVKAKVSMYRDNLQLQIHDAADLKIIKKAAPEKSAAPVPEAASSATSSKPETKSPTTPPAGPSEIPGTVSLEGITPSMLGQDVTVQATITEIREPRSERAPYLVTLTENNAHIPLVYWSDMQPQLKDKIKVGNQVRLKGQVSEYRNALQLKLHSAADLTVVSAP